MKFQDINRENLKHSLNELLYNPIYKNQVNKVSQIFRDRPLPAMDTAMYWIDYVIRHRGAPHNRSSGLDLKWYEFYLLDVILFVVLCLVIILVTTFVVLKQIIKLVNQTSKVKVN